MTDQFRLETYKSMITISIEGFKFLALANGGAAIALLAYLGNIAGKSLATPNMQLPMFFFLTGIAICGAAMFVAYLTQYKLLNEKNGDEEKNKKLKHNHLLHTAIVLFALSLIAFLIGAWTAVVRFQ